MAAYTQCLRCAGAPRRPAGGSGLSLPFLLGMPLSMTPGSSIIASPELRCRHGLRRDLSSSALPILPQSVSRGARISGLPDSRICYGLPSCSLHGLTAEWLINQETIKPILRDAMENQDFGVFSALRRFVPTGYPCLITKIMRSQIIGTAVKPVAVFESSFYSQRSAGFEVLSHQDLIREGGTGFNFGPEEAPLSVGCWELTELGYAFVARIV